jgi:hypothetical protein
MLKFVSNHAHLLKQFLILFSINVQTFQEHTSVSVVADGMVIMVITDTCQLHLKYLHYGKETVTFRIHVMLQVVFMLRTIICYKYSITIGFNDLGGRKTYRPFFYRILCIVATTLLDHFLSLAYLLPMLLIV